MKDPTVREQFLDVARQYEELALSIEQLPLARRGQPEVVFTTPDIGHSLIGEGRRACPSCGVSDSRNSVPQHPFSCPLPERSSVPFAPGCSRVALPSGNVGLMEDEVFR